MAEKVPIFNDPVQLEVRNQVIKLESDEIVKSRRDIDILDSDINTTRRQVEIIEDSSQRKSNSIFLLKTVMSYLLFILIPILLTIKNVITKSILTYIIISLTVLFGIIILYNLRSVMKRDPNRFSLRDFGKTIKPSTHPTKCVSNPKSKTNPEQQELQARLEQLQSLDNQLKIVEERRKEIDIKRKDIDTEVSTIESRFNAKYPDNVLEKEIEKNLASRSRIS
jgi:chaperonin cofactor prefoldin